MAAHGPGVPLSRLVHEHLVEKARAGELMSRSCEVCEAGRRLGLVIRYGKVLVKAEANP